MKLNKVLALALSGVMAVSMLAGCSTGKTDDNKDEQVPATGIVAAVNDGQDADNKVKVTFTSDATLDTQLSKAVAAAGNDAWVVTVQDKLETILGGSVFNLTDSNWDTVGANKFMVSGQAMKSQNVTSEKTVGVVVFKTSDNYTEAAALKQIAGEVNEVTEKLKSVSGNPTTVDAPYATYEYTGTVSMIEASDLDGNTYYYAAIVITNNCTLKTVTINY